MANSLKQTQSEMDDCESSNDTYFKNDLIEKYTTTLNKMKDVAKTIEKRNHILYGNTKPRPTNSSVDDILAQITQDVNLLENASIGSNAIEPRTRTKSKEFVSFSAVSADVINVDKPTKKVDATSVESHMTCNAQLTELDPICKLALNDSFNKIIAENEPQFEGDSQDLELCNLLIQYEDSVKLANKNNTACVKTVSKVSDIVSDIPNQIKMDITDYCLESDDFVSNNHSKVVKMNTDSFNLGKEFLISTTPTKSSNSIEFQKASVSTNTLLVDDIELDYDDSPSSPILSTQSKRSFSSAPKSNAMYKLDHDESRSHEILNNPRLNAGNPRVDKNLNAARSIYPKKFEGFMTANKKEIKVSQKALRKVKNLYDDCLENELINQCETSTNDYPGTISDNCTKLNIRTGANVDSSKFSFYTKMNENCTNDQTTLKGFTTASNKEIKITEQALIKVKNLFDDCSESPWIDQQAITKNKPNTVNSTRFSNNILLSPGHLPFNTSTNENNLNCQTLFKGFTTASNKEIKVTDQALRKVKNLFDDCSKDELIHQEEVNTKKKSSFISTNCGFDIANTSSVNSVNFSADRNMNDQTVFRGFLTASNKEIKVSEQALKKVKNLFDDCKDDNLVDRQKKDNDKIIGDIPANIKDMEISNSAFAITRDASVEPNINKNNSKHQDNFGGFMTANNKKIEVSEKALKRVKNLFDDCSEGELIHQKEVNSKSFSSPISTNSGVNKITNIYGMNSGNISADINTNDQTVFKGFLTASNKEIKVSEQALKKVKNLFDDCANENLIVKKQKDDNKILGHVPANDDDLEISNNAFLIIKDTSVEPNIHQNNSKHHDNLGEFMTANYKKIEVSEKALKRVKNLFDDCSNSEWNDQPICSNKFGASPEKFSTANKTIKSLPVLDKTQDNIQMINIDHDIDFNQIKSTSKVCMPGFQSANNKEIKISKDALKKAQQLFKESDCSIKLVNSNKNISKNTDFEIQNSHNAIILSNTELSTKEMVVDPIEPPGSPILQFKGHKTKRKLFKAPYKNDTCVKEETNKYKRRKIESPLSENLNSTNAAVEVKNIFSLGNLSLRKSKRGFNAISLKSIYQRMQLEDTTKKSDLPNVPNDCLSFQFKNLRYDIVGTSILSVSEFEILFKNHPDINSKLIPNGWILNHLKWIIWKLAFYEKKFSKQFSDSCLLKVTNVIEQLKYRYDIELYDAKRPILRKILEKDEVPSKRMILCVSSIIPVEISTVIDENSVVNKLGQPQYEIELTDGWYSVLTVLDSILCQAINNGKIEVGTKLIINGAELINCEQGVAPLEDMGAVRLKIFANSCRRCLPWLKLGLCKRPGPMTLKLEDCKPGGGPIPNIQIMPITVYPMMYMSKSSNGSIEMRSEKLQQIFNTKLDNELQAQIEKLYADIEKEFSDGKNNCKKSVSLISGNKKNDLSPDELTDMLEIAADPQEFMNSLSYTQREAVQQISIERQAKVRYEIDSRVKAVLNEKGLIKEKPVRVLKARILTPSKNDDYTSAILTIWRPDDALVEEIREGIYFNVTNLSPTGYRKGDLHVSAGKKSTFTQIFNEKIIKTISGLGKFQKSCTPFENIYENNFSPPFNEVDVVGLVIKIEPKVFDSINNQNKIQTVYMANEFKKIIAIVFWNGIKNSGFEKIIDEGKCLACQNLQNRSRALTKRIRQLHVIELSNFTTSSKKNYIDNALNNLKKNLHTDLKMYVNECLQELSAIMSGAITPKKVFNASVNSNISTSTLQSQYNNNFTKEEYDELNLTGLDFESTFIDTTANDTLNMDTENKVVNLAPTNLNRSSVLTESNISVLESPSRVEMRINRLKMYGEPPRLSPVVMRNSRWLNKTFNNPMANNSVEIKFGTSNNENETEEDVLYSPPLSLE